MATSASAPRITVHLSRLGAENCRLCKGITTLACERYDACDALQWGSLQLLRQSIKPVSAVEAPAVVTSNPNPPAAGRYTYLRFDRLRPTNLLNVAGSSTPALSLCNRGGFLHSALHRSLLGQTKPARSTALGYFFQPVPLRGRAGHSVCKAQPYPQPPMSPSHDWATRMHTLSCCVVAAAKSSTVELPWFWHSMIVAF